MPLRVKSCSDWGRAHERSWTQRRMRSRWTTRSVVRVCGASGAGVLGWPARSTVPRPPPTLSRQQVPSASGLIHKASPLRTPALSLTHENPARLMVFVQMKCPDTSDTCNSLSPFGRPQNHPQTLGAATSVQPPVALSSHLPACGSKAQWKPTGSRLVWGVGVLGLWNSESGCF